jgi:hypothetical protein
LKKHSVLKGTVTKKKENRVCSIYVVSAQISIASKAPVAVAVIFAKI